MAAQRIRQERRRHERVTAPEGAYAVMMPGSNILGPVIDVSKGGLAFRYLSNTEASAMDKSAVSILFNRKRFYLSMMPCDVVADVEADNDVPFSAVPVRRCSLRFRDASLFQDSQLQHFITHHTRSGDGTPFFSNAPASDAGPLSDGASSASSYFNA